MLTSTLVRADDIQKGLRPRRSVRTAMAHEINMCVKRLNTDSDCL